MGEAWRTSSRYSGMERGRYPGHPNYFQDIQAGKSPQAGQTLSWATGRQQDLGQPIATGPGAANSNRTLASQ